MGNMKTRAQTATEYLVILAVVIIIALMVVAALGGIPSIGRGSKVRASSAYWATADIAIVAHSMDPDGTDNIYKLRNNMERTVAVHTFRIGGNDLILSGTYTIAPGETYTFDSLNLNAQIDCEANKYYAYDVVIGYTDEELGTDQLLRGDMKLEGRCTE